MNNRDDLNDGALLASLLSEALSGLEYPHWRFFFPFLMATWRFIVARRPGVLDELDASFADPPTFRGRGSKWFCETLADAPDFLDREEKMMYWLSSRIPEKAKLRGFLRSDEVPNFDAAEMREIARVVLGLVDRAKADGAL